jgi:Ca-activated chloride channel family protein
MGVPAAVANTSISKRNRTMTGLRFLFRVTLRRLGLAADNDIRIHAIGVGSESLRVPGLLGILGNRTVNPSADLDEATLQQIASATSGRYFRARDTAELDEIYQLLDRLEPVVQEAATYRPVRSLFHVPLAASWLLFMLCIGWPAGAARSATSGATPEPTPERTPPREGSVT